ncbi:MAG: hypothetical protein WCD18_13545 [Thermosynechococcaceae cyanobacterium]
MTERWTDETLDRFAASVATAITASNERMTRIENDWERSMRESDERMEELTAVTQAISRDVAQLVATQEQNSRELTQAMIRLADTQEGVAGLLANLDEDRPTILRFL